jgi:hypothetical protein
VQKGSAEYDYYLQGLVMRGVAPRPEYQISVTIWSCMFRTEFLREHAIRFESFCDYEDDWITCIRAFRAANTVCLESRTVYVWRIHDQSESHNRIVHDRYIEDFYEKYSRMRAFLLESVAQTGLSERERFVFERELQKEGILWTLSNETGRGISGRTIAQSVTVVKQTVQAERDRGFYRGMVTHPLSTTGYGVSRVKRNYHIVREAFLTFLLLHHMEGAAVRLNKKLLHGRWHN